MKVFAVDIGSEFSLGNQGVENVFPNFGSLFNTILFNIYAIAGIIFLFLLIFGGINLIIGAGGQNSGKVEQGQKAVSSAIIGFVIIFASYFIIQIIEVLTGAKILNTGL